MTDALDTRLNGLLEKATKGPWEADTQKSEGDYGSGPDCHTGFDVATIMAGDLVLFDALNSNAGEVSEDGPDEYGEVYAWDEISKHNAALIVEAVNALPKLLADRLSDRAELALYREQFCQMTEALRERRERIGELERALTEIRDDYRADARITRIASAALGGAKP